MSKNIQTPYNHHTYYIAIEHGPFIVAFAHGDFNHSIAHRYILPDGKFSS